MIRSRFAGIHAETLYQVPLGETLETWRVRITNERETAASLSLFGTVEFCLWDAKDDATNFQRNYSIGEVEVEDGVIYHKSEYRERRDHFAWFACSEPVAGFDTQRDVFIGAVPGLGPAARGRARGVRRLGGQRLAADRGPPRAARARAGRDAGGRRSCWATGRTPPTAKFDPPGSQRIDKRLVRPVIERHLRPDRVAQTFDELRGYWRSLLGALEVDTGNEHVDRMVNIWNAYQCMVTFNLSRSASLFESGIGRGMGFRDSNQDLLGLRAPAPRAGARTDPGRRGHPARRRRRLPPVPAADEARQRRHRRRTSTTTRSGWCWPWRPTSRRPGDRDILTSLVPFDNDPHEGAPLYEHLQRAFVYTARPHSGRTGCR